MSRNALWVILIALTLLLSCDSERPQPSLEAQLLGTWDLATVAGQPVNRSGFHDWHISFEPGAAWHYTGQLSGTLAGMHVSGKGHWQLQRNTLRFAAEGYRGSCIVKISADELTLTPDPVLANHVNGNPTITTYLRHRVVF